MPRRKKSRQPKHVYLLLAFAALIIVSAVSDERSIASRPPTAPHLPLPEPTNATQRTGHVHADFAVFLHGEKLDFSKQEYDDVLPALHLHVQNQDGGSVLHAFEARDNATLGSFFASLGMSFDRDCFSTGAERYCSNRTHELRFYVNGAPHAAYGSYEPRDLDRILISYGSESPEEVMRQMKSVTVAACILSGNCPSGSISL